MKKRLLLLLLLAILPGAYFLSKAQTWTPPALTFSTLTTGTTYYVYNVGSKGYLSRGGWYLTQAVVCAQPKFDPSTVTKWTATNTSGSVWTFQYNENGSDVTGKYLFCANADPNDGSVYTDNSTNNTWNVVFDAPTNTYSIQVVNTYGGYDASKYLGSAFNPEWCDFWGWGPRPASMVRYNRASGDGYTQWKFASQADMDLYNAKVLLDKYMNYAKIRGGIDISSYITTYNAGVTADINTAAGNLLTALGRTDVTSSITNPSFETASQAGWTNSGGFANQTNTSFCKKDGTNYTEKWGGGSFLSTGTITQTISGLANGVYGIVASGYTEGGIHSGAFFTAGTSSTQINLCDDYNVDYATVTNGKLTIGFALSGQIGCHWVAFDNFRLHYYGAIVAPFLTASASSLALDNLISVDSFTVSSLNLTNPITLTAPTGITLSTYSITANTSDAPVKVTYDGSTAVNGNITLTSGTKVVNIPLTASSNVSCYTPLFPGYNLIPNPYLNSLNGFSGWGTKEIVTRPDSVYCGSRSAKITGSGSIDADFPVLRANTSYIMKAQVLTVGGTFRIGINGLGSGVANIDSIFDTQGKWKTQYVKFKTGPTNVTATKCWFNNGSPLTGTKGYIDNWEFYAMPYIKLSSSSLTFAGASSKKVAVTGSNTTSTISIIPPAGFSVNPTSLPATATHDTVVITFDGVAASNGYVRFISDTIKDSIQVTGILGPLVTTAPSFLTFDELNTTATFTVTAANLSDSVRFTLPSGFTVDRKGFARDTTNAVVTVTFNGLSNSKGYITLTSGTASARVRVLGSILTPLYATGNLIADPNFNSLSTYAGSWGLEKKSIITDTAIVYNGTRCAKITDACGSSIDYVLTGKLQANTTYRLRAMVNCNNEFFFTLHGCGIDGSTSDYQKMINTGSTWDTLDFNFTTGTLATDQYLWMNSCSGSNRASIAYLDNLELYNVTPLVTLSDLTVNGSTVAGFNSTVHTYDVVLTTIPTIAATAVVAGSVVEITQATAIPGTATVKVTSADGFVSSTYTINITAYSTDATLSALSVSADTLKPVFAPATLKYYVQVPRGSAIPTVTATANHAGATVAVTPATSVPDTTIVQVTAEDGTTTKNYLVNMWDIKLTGTIIGHSGSYNSDPATLIAAAFDGNTATFVDALTATGYVGLDLGEGKKAKLTSMRYFPRTTHVSRMVGGEIRGANSADLSDSVILYKITATPSITTYTDVVLSVTGTYRYIYYYSPAEGYCNIAELELYGDTTTSVVSSVASLSALQIDGTTVTGFTSGTTTYNVVLPYGTTVIPTVSATATESHATVTITQTASVTGSASVVVTAQDGTTQLTYTINFSVAKSNVATLSDLTVNGTTVSGFAAATTSYNVVLPAGTTTIPTVAATTTDPNATASVIQATELSGFASVVVTAENGTTTKTYTISFSVGSGIIGANGGGVKVYPTITSGNFIVETDSKAIITVLDSKGRVVSKQVAASSLQTVHIKDSGMYFIKVTSNGSNSIFKVVKTQ